jgi:hypothetical protein
MPPHLEDYKMSKAKNASKGGLRKVRLLVDGHLGRVNQVVELGEEEITAAVGGGLADDTPEAVAYAENLEG